MMAVIKRVILVLVALGVLGAGVGIWMIQTGSYDVAATQPHLEIAYRVMHHAMRRSVKARVAGIEVPPMDQPDLIARGDALYREHCLQCHGGPGVSPHPIALGMRPLPSNLAQAGGEWPPAEIYWVVKHGVRMSAMPGWEYRLSEGDMWAVTAFVKQLPRVSPQAFMAAAPAFSSAWATTSHAGAPPTHASDAHVGKHLIAQYMCATCHQIPGIAGAVNAVGPPLGNIADRVFIGGVLNNTPDNMTRWLLNPQRINPGSAMPNLHMSEGDARDIAAFLAILHGDDR
jgi:mono/diheme cytochrome c family protein